MLNVMLQEFLTKLRGRLYMSLAKPFSSNRPYLLSFVKTTALELDLLCLLCLTVTALKTTLLAPLPTLFFCRAARYADVSRFSLESPR